MISFVRWALGFGCVMGAAIWMEVLVWSNPDMTDRRLWLDHPLQLLGAGLLAFFGAMLVVSTFLKEDKP